MPFISRHRQAVNCPRAGPVGLLVRGLRPHLAGFDAKRMKLRRPANAPARSQTIELAFVQPDERFFRWRRSATRPLCVSLRSRMHGDLWGSLRRISRCCLSVLIGVCVKMSWASHVLIVVLKIAAASKITCQGHPHQVVAHAGKRAAQEDAQADGLGRSDG